jgi:L-ascorbate metabolism protein UlaG (beta-lactamase superfamily)
VRLTYLGTATLLLEIDGLRLLTDPALDPAGAEYAMEPMPGVAISSRKLAGPALTAEELGRIDAVLLSHDEHFDNLDDSGRAFLPQAGLTVTTPGGAERLGGNARGLAPWESLALDRVRVTAVPARHGPDGSEPVVGHVTGFVLEWEGQRHGALYVSGDTVLFDGLLEVGERFDIGTAVLHLGAGGFDAAPGVRLTLDAAEGARLADALGARTVVPVHYDGWTHFTEPREAAEGALGERALWLVPGQTTTLEV